MSEQGASGKISLSPLDVFGIARSSLIEIFRAERGYKLR
jgi:hypothetical protein